MTDNEIIKALECCHKQHHSNCEACPNEETCEEIDIIDSVITLINRKDTEINELKKLLDKRCDRCIEQNKSEAIKKFAEKLKNLHTEYDTVTKREIDSLAEEMTESEENDV